MKPNTTSPPPGASAGREERGETTMTVTTKPGVLLDVETYNRLHHAAQRENEACWVTSALRYCLALLRECPADHPSRPLVDEYVQLVVGEPRHWFDPSRLAADLRIARDVDAKMRAQGEDPTEADLESATKRQFRGLLGEVAELRSALAAERAAGAALPDFRDAYRSEVDKALAKGLRQEVAHELGLFAAYLVGKAAGRAARALAADRETEE